jgi:hypothetical protein
MKNLKIANNKLSREEQKSINGGIGAVHCHDRYIAEDFGNRCAVPSGFGGVLYGTIQNGKCCTTR